MVLWAMVKWIFTHGDGDGICSGALALAANPDAKIFFTHPFGLLEDLKNASAGDVVIVCDIALSENNVSQILERFSDLSVSGNLIYIDHHPLPEWLPVESIPGIVIYDVGASSSELTYRFFESELAWPMDRVAIYGAIADYMDDTPIINKLLGGWDKRAVYFEVGVLVQGLEGHKRDYDFKRSIVSHLSLGLPPSLHQSLLTSAIESAKREEEIIRGLKEHIQIYGEVAYTLDFPFPLGKTAIYARALAGTRIGVAGERRSGLIDMSIRTCEERIDLNRILRRITLKLGGSGGGHPKAAGARIPEENFQKFIKELNEAALSTG
ncbi:MAG: DHHA1 domain-containing protein [Candidatus Bathyarchaeia archaeon]|nr:DHH family phosphoesterase [Candidatus Bathyarchaeota archaeon]